MNSDMKLGVLLRGLMHVGRAVALALQPTVEGRPGDPHEHHHHGKGKCIHCGGKVGGCPHCNKKAAQEGH